MSAKVLSCSAAVQVSWKVAAVFARSNGGKIEPVHFLYSIFSLDKYANTIEPSEMKVSVMLEVAALVELCSLHSIRFQEMRRRVRARNAFSTKESAFPSFSSRVDETVSRSDRVRGAFDEALATTGGKQVGLLSLTHALLRSEPNAGEYCGLQVESFQRFLSVFEQTIRRTEHSAALAEEVSSEQMLVVDSLDAQAILADGVDWTKVGPHFAALCELGWEAGISVRLEDIYESALERILRAVGAAKRGAVMMIDESGKFLLKGHLPKGVLSASTSSARQAVNQRRSFIWQRGEDLSVSQLESATQAGIYAPILSSSESFGVICVDADAPASEFTRSDLFLLTSMGHQLGLIVANRRLEQQLRQNVKLVERLLTNFSPKVRQRLLAKAEAGRLKLGGEKSIISIICCDIRGFTRLARDMDTEDVVSLLNEYFTALVAVIFRHGGTVDKFVGDAMLAVFGSPEADIMHAENSLACALEMQTEVGKISVRREALGMQSCLIGIGVHTGEVIHGFIGSPERMEFTVIGNAVNLATRFCDAAKGGDTIVSGEILERAWKYAIVEPVDIQTKHEGTIAAYRLTGVRKSR